MLLRQFTHVITREVSSGRGREHDQRAGNVEWNEVKVFLAGEVSDCHLALAEARVNFVNCDLDPLVERVFKEGAAKASHLTFAYSWSIPWLLSNHFIMFDFFSWINNPVDVQLSPLLPMCFFDCSHKDIFFAGEFDASEFSFVPTENWHVVL